MPVQQGLHLFKIDSTKLVLCKILRIRKKFTQKQRIFILENYFATKSYAQTISEFESKFPTVAPPNKSSIMRLVKISRWRHYKE